MIFILKLGDIIHMNIGDRLKNNLRELFLLTVIAFFVLIGFEFIAESICFFAKLNRIQSEVCYNITGLIGYIVAFFVGIFLKVKRYSLLKYFVFIVIILAMYLSYDRYLFFLGFNTITKNLFIYICKPVIHCILLLIGIFLGKIFNLYYNKY